MICYPERVVGQMQLKGLATDDWQRVAIYRLVQICKVVSSKYTPFQGEKENAAGICLCDR